MTEKQVESKTEYYFLKVKIGDKWCEAMTLGKDIIIQTNKIPKDCIKWEKYENQEGKDDRART